ncbi:hypothetical protein FS749_007997 [Ceratobasidium sp. UAMH 11750]|nr:hypothetical protein FS749_007997 [Ceratobasidium sp. UAMH 11750]
MATLSKPSRSSQTTVPSMAMLSKSSLLSQATTLRKATIIRNTFLLSSPCPLSKPLLSSKATIIRKATITRKYHPALQQPMAPHGFAEDTGTPHQPVSFQPNLAPQPLDVHPQFAPQAAATAAVPAPVPEVPQVLADPPVDESSDSDPEGVGAPFLFEANVWLNKTRRSLGLRSWNEMKDALSKEDIKNLENLAGQFNKGHWVESLRRMSKEDFKTYYLIKRELCKQHNKPPPRLPAWVKKYVFGNDKLQDYTLITPHYAATMAL